MHIRVQMCIYTRTHTHIYIYFHFFIYRQTVQYAYVTYIDNTHTCTEHIWPMETISFHFSIPTWSNDVFLLVMGRDYQPAGPEGPAGPAGPTGGCRGRDDAEAHGALPDAGTASSGTILATAHQHHLALDCEPPPLLLFTCLNVVWKMATAWALQGYDSVWWCDWVTS